MLGRKMLLIALSVMGVFIIYLGLESLNQSSVSVSAEKDSSPSETEIAEILEKIKDKTHKKYNIGTYNINSNVDNNSQGIDIEIIGSQKYYDSVKNEIKEVVKSTTTSTSFEDYSININKSRIDQVISEERREEHLLIHEIMVTINDYLSEFYPDQLDKIDLDYTAPELRIEVKLLLNETASGEGKEMEKNIYIYLEENLSSNKFVKNKSVKINIFNSHGEKTN